MTTPFAALIGAACPLYVGSHNSGQMSLVILRLLCPLWVLGETMGRFRPSYPQSLSTALGMPLPPLIYIYIYIYQCITVLKVVAQPPTTTGAPPRLLTKGWRDGGVNLGLYGDSSATLHCCLQSLFAAMLLFLLHCLVLSRRVLVWCSFK